ncbi:GNAT family N-acetyltransferase [Paenibacillus hemerocallicola]|uniref:GNAT family N-acetyltransferase n=1 Tax=Paenibacillus hemerocallicola TaxID=1172614 RepID=UPI00159ECE49|nr:GNAT family N-acetyltransferase [Paenibacillus hemerocallicola]
MERIGVQSVVLGIPVPGDDYDRAIEWYVDVLGCELVWKMGIAQVRLPSGQKLLIFSPEDDSESIWFVGNEKDHPGFSVQFVTPDIRKLREKLIDSGARAGEVLKGGGGGLDMKFQDPFGNRYWAIENPKPGSVPAALRDREDRKSLFKEEMVGSERIRLRLTEQTDLDFVLEVESAEENRAYIGQWTTEQHSDAVGSPDLAHLIVTDRHTGERIGYVMLNGLNKHSQSIELKRLVIVSKGEGYGTDVLEVVKKLAFAHWNVRRLWLDVRTENVRAERLYASLGFRQEGILRDCEFVDGRFVSLQIMSMLRDEYV